MATPLSAEIAHRLTCLRRQLEAAGLPIDSLSVISSSAAPAPSTAAYEKTRNVLVARAEMVARARGYDQTIRTPRRVMTTAEIRGWWLYATQRS